MNFYKKTTRTASTYAITFICRSAYWISEGFNDVQKTQDYETGIYWALHYGVGGSVQPSMSYFGNSSLFTFSVGHDGNVFGVDAALARRPRVVAPQNP
jgi:hypothetical protein